MGGDKAFHALIAQLEFEFASYSVTVQRLSYFAWWTYPWKLIIFNSEEKNGYYRMEG